MRTQFLFLKFMRSFLIGFTAGIISFGTIAVLLFSLYLAFFA